MIAESASLVQAAALAKLEQAHGKMRLLGEDGVGIVEHILSNSVTDTRVYVCPDCLGVFAIEPDGEVALWRVSLEDPAG